MSVGCFGDAPVKKALDTITLCIELLGFFPVGGRIFRLGRFVQRITTLVLLLESVDDKQEEQNYRQEDDDDATDDSCQSKNRQIQNRR